MVKEKVVVNEVRREPGATGGGGGGRGSGSRTYTYHGDNWGTALALYLPFVLKTNTRIVKFGCLWLHSTYIQQGRRNGLAVAWALARTLWTRDVILHCLLLHRMIR